MTAGDITTLTIRTSRDRGLLQHPPPGEGWDEGIESQLVAMVDPLSLALSRRERELLA